MSKMWLYGEIDNCTAIVMISILSKEKDEENERL